MRRKDRGRRTPQPVVWQRLVVNVVLIDQFEQHVRVWCDGLDETLPMCNLCRVELRSAGKRRELHVEAMLRAQFEEVWQSLVEIRILARDQQADWLMVWTLA